MTDQPYNASSIRILSDAELGEFPWVKLRALSAQYRGVAPECIQRLIEAQLMSGEDWAIVERRYLQHDKTVAVSPEFVAVYLELADQRRTTTTRSTAHDWKP